VPISPGRWSTRSVPSWRFLVRRSWSGGRRRFAGSGDRASAAASSLWREDLYQLLFTYALVLVLADAAKLLWGTQQLSVQRPGILDGALRLFGVIVPHYNLFIMVLGPAIALSVWLVLYGRILAV